MTKVTKDTGSETKAVSTAQSWREMMKTYNIDTDQLKPVDLVVPEGDTYTISTARSDLQSKLIEFKPRTIDEVKLLLGVSVETVSPLTQINLSRLPTFKSVRKCTSDDSCEMKVNPAHRFTTQPEKERKESVRNVRKVAYEMVYRNFETADAIKKLVNSYLELSEAIIWGILFQNITILNGATLNVAANTHILFANNVKMYGTGKIVSQGPLTLKCSSCEGQL